MANDVIGTIGAAGITAIGALAATGIAYKAIDSTMKSSGLYPKQKRRKGKKS